jgi:membrane protease YdiL (CAAX protease family)
MTEQTSQPMKPKLNTGSALLTVVLYLVFSIIAALLARIFLGGSDASSAGRVLDGVIGSGMVANLVVMAGLLYVSIRVFKESRKDIFFERKPFGLSKRYYLFPLVWFGVTLFALTQVDYASYAVGAILLVLVVSLAIGVNEEIVTRGILLVGLRNSKVAEWLAWLITVVVFAVLHLVNVLGGGSLTIVFIVVTGGTLLYVSRRVFGNLFVPIGLHALYDTAFFLLTGKYAAGESLPDHVLDIQLGAFLVLMVASILFLIFGRKLFKQESTGWPSN